MSTTKDFENAPVGATATHPNGSRAMKMDDSELGWIIRTGHYWSGEVMARWGYTLDSPAPATAREALDLARPLPTREEIADVILAESLFGSRTPIAAADAVLALLKGQEV